MDAEHAIAARRINFLFSSGDMIIFWLISVNSVERTRTQLSPRDVLYENDRIARTAEIITMRISCWFQRRKRDMFASDKIIYWIFSKFSNQVQLLW